MTATLGAGTGKQIQVSHVGDMNPSTGETTAVLLYLYWKEAELKG